MSTLVIVETSFVYVGMLLRYLTSAEKKIFTGDAFVLYELSVRMQNTFADDKDEDENKAWYVSSGKSAKEAIGYEADVLEGSIKYFTPDTIPIEYHKILEEIGLVPFEQSKD